MALLLIFVVVLHLVTLAMLFIATMEKVNLNALEPQKHSYMETKPTCCYHASSYIHG